MKRSTERILTTHAGSLPRPPDLLELIQAKATGRSYDEAVAAMARMNPGGRLIEPLEVAAAVVALLADDTTNGEAIVLDGTAPAPGRTP